MKKYLYIVLGLIGVGLVGYSVLQGWASWTQSTQFGMGMSIEPVPGYKYWQGIVAGLSGVLAFFLLFMKPKLAIVPGLIASGMALWLYLVPPMAEDMTLSPQKAILLCVGGGVALALAGLVAPKKR